MSGGTRTATGLATAFVGDVCVFAKPPVAWQVKTRLALTLGQTAATELATKADRAWPGRPDPLRAMMHAMSPAPSAPPSPSRLRRHAAPLVLVAACLGTVATSPQRTPSSISAVVSSTARLTQDTPTSTHRFVVQVSARDSSEIAGVMVWGS